MPALAPVMATTWSWSDSMRPPLCVLRSASGVERLRVAVTDGDPGPGPIRVCPDETLVVDGQLGLEVAARVAVGELVEAGVRLVGLDHGQLRETDPGCFDRLRCPDAESQPADRERVRRRAAAEVDVGRTLER